MEKLEEKQKFKRLIRLKLRKGYIELKYHIEVVVETPSLDEKVEDKAINTHSDDSIEILNSVEKKIQTVTCIMKNKASQTD